MFNLSNFEIFLTVAVYLLGSYLSISVLRTLNVKFYYPLPLLFILMSGWGALIAMCSYKGHSMREHGFKLSKNLTIKTPTYNGMLVLLAFLNTIMIMVLSMWAVSPPALLGWLAPPIIMLSTLLFNFYLISKSNLPVLSYQELQDYKQVLSISKDISNEILNAGAMHGRPLTPQTKLKAERVVVVSAVQVNFIENLFGEKNEFIATDTLRNK